MEPGESKGTHTYSRGHQLVIKPIIYKLKQRVQQARLEAGEKGFGQPAPPPVFLSGIGSDKQFNVAVIGAGAQGLKQVKAIQNIPGVRIGGIADFSESQLAKANALGVSEDVLYTDAEDLFRSVGKLDMVSIATTAPSHVELGRVALKHEVKKILLEKPFDTSLPDAKDFVDECTKRNAQLEVNYSRRWMVDYQAIARCIGQGLIGETRSIAISVGGGELAMHASHYFDLCVFILKSQPAEVTSRLVESDKPNARGSSFVDPSGFCTIVFQNGARAFVDFSEDLGPKNPLIVIKGDGGQITVDESRGFWTLQSRSRKVWSFPFAEPMKSEITFKRVICEFLSRASLPTIVYDGIPSLELIFACHLSNQKGGVPVSLPLPADQKLPEVLFP